MLFHFGYVIWFLVFLGFIDEVNRRNGSHDHTTSFKLMIPQIIRNHLSNMIVVGRFLFCVSFLFWSLKSCSISFFFIFLIFVFDCFFFENFGYLSAVVFWLCQYLHLLSVTVCCLKSPIHFISRLIFIKKNMKNTKWFVFTFFS